MNLSKDIFSSFITINNMSDSLTGKSSIRKTGYNTSTQGIAESRVGINLVILSTS